MSGHSKWSTIKRKKGAADAKRGAVFTRLSKDITLAARDGGGDSDMNPTLRFAIKKAKSSNMPAANIDRAIKKGTGELPGVIYENYIYEGYGPSGVAVLIEVLSDNKNRTFPEIKSIMSKNGGNLGESGCVNWMFEKKGVFTLQINNIEEDKLMELLENSDVEDIIFDDNLFEIIVSSNDFKSISTIFENNQVEYDGEISLVPQNFIQLNLDEANQVIKLLEIIENHEDVQKVHTNFQIK